MTTRDLFWRAGGVVLIVVASAIGRTDAAGGSAAAGLAGFLLAITGLVLLVQGKRVPLSLRIERSRHRELPGAIRARYRARSRHR